MFSIFTTLSAVIVLLLFNSVHLYHSYPTLLIHGILSNEGQLNELSENLSLRGHDNYIIEIGNGKWTSLNQDMNKQCLELANEIKALEIKETKINLLGISQGGLLARCYVEKYSHDIKTVHSLITWVTPHMGIYNKLVPSFPFLSFSGYLKDPFNYNYYLDKNTFLSFINNEKFHEEDEKYKENMEILDYFILAGSPIDQTIIPYQSSLFEYYSIDEAERNDKLIIQPFNDSSQNIFNLIGLRKLLKTYRMYTFIMECQHNEFKLAICFNKKREKYDNKTLLELINPFL
uniref:DUF676 domain-containing protein n=1 Tax=viral metagenome TaxID=1070528 RepID=A0A6C0KHQ7_9ZZZZ